jgi:protease secretion system membrane fusion protein
MSIEQHESPGQSVLNADAGAMARLGLWVLGVGFGGFLLWAGFAPLDQGMAGSGTVVVSGERKMVQPLVGGAVQAIFVREGDLVSQGQPLVQLNSVQLRAQLDAAVGQWISARCLEARLTAEQVEAGRIDWPPDLLVRSSDSRVKPTIGLQNRLFETRQQELRTRRQMVDHELLSLEGDLASYQVIRRHQESRLAAQEKELNSYRVLLDKGFISRSRVHEVEVFIGELGVDLSTAISNISRTQQAINENQLKRLQIAQVFRSEVEAQLTQVNAEVASLVERIKALEFEVDSARILAPVSGQVMDLAVHTVGGIVPAGQRLMDVVPQQVGWLIKARFPVMAADRLHPGLPVAIRFSSLQRTSTPVLTGRVATVSADQIVDSQTRLPYYQVMVQPDLTLLKGLRRVGMEVKPGMEVEVLANTGERTLLNYLVRPIVERMSGALREE